jgi:hypothetical protein
MRWQNKLMYCTMTAGVNRFSLTRVSSFRNGSANISIRAISGAFFIGPPGRTRVIEIENEGWEFLFAAAGYRLGTGLYHGNNYVRLLRDYFALKYSILFARFSLFASSSGNATDFYAAASLCAAIFVTSSCTFFGISFFCRHCIV